MFDNKDIEGFKGRLEKSLKGSGAFLGECLAEHTGCAHSTPTIHILVGSLFFFTFADIVFKRNVIQVGFNSNLSGSPLGEHLSGIVQKEIKQFFPQKKKTIQWGSTTTTPEF